MEMTLEELRSIPLWKELPHGVRDFLRTAEENGWELHGKGATIAFRVDNKTDELAAPLYVIWEIGKTPKGKTSFFAGRGGVPGQAISVADAIEVMKDPTIMYPAEETTDAEQA